MCQAYIGWSLKGTSKLIQFVQNNLCRQHFNHVWNHQSTIQIESKQVSWCFTPSQPVRLYQGDRKTESNAHNLMTETDRYLDIPREQRLCTACKETEHNYFLSPKDASQLITDNRAKSTRTSIKNIVIYYLLIIWKTLAMYVFLLSSCLESQECHLIPIYSFILLHNPVTFFLS